MKGKISSDRAQELGIANVWVALTLFVLVSMVGLSIEMGYLSVVGEQLQIGADAAALAAAQHVRDDDTLARSAAVDVAYANLVARAPLQLSLNTGNGEDGDIVFGRYDRDARVFTATDSARNAVKVVARRTSSSLGGQVPLTFGRVLGHETTDMTREAIAMIGGGTGAGLIVLNESKKNALDIGGNCNVIVNGGAIQVNSGNAEGAYIHGNPTIDAVVLNCVGGINVSGNPGIGEYNEGAPAIPDPLASLPAPTWNPASDLGAIRITGGESLIKPPGYYSGGISMMNGSLTLLPGIYILDGAGLNVTGGNFIADGVMLYITGTGSVNLVGNGIMRITAPDPELYSFPGVDTYEGVAIFQARDNTNQATMVGTGLLNLGGSYYFPANHVKLSGDSTRFGNQLIANTMDISGHGTITINYDGRFPAPGGRVFLVK